MTKSRKNQKARIASQHVPGQLPTFLDHVHELRRRLFWVAGVVVAGSAVSYPFADSILRILTEPLRGQQLYYLTPIGGFSFAIKICMYVGVLAAVPVFVYHLYKYLEPLMTDILRRSSRFYVGMSSLLAMAGVAFAYFISLPGALRFLTGLDLANIQAMLTADSYLSFVTAYMIGAALLFQIPLILMIINSFTPLKPGKLMGLQRFVIVGAFILAAIISPTPDIVNQIILAIPVVMMYQVGVIAVWMHNRRADKRAGKVAAPQVATSLPVRQEPTPLRLLEPKRPATIQPVGSPVLPAFQGLSNTARRTSMDGFIQPRVQHAMSRVTASPAVVDRRTSGGMHSLFPARPVRAVSTVTQSFSSPRRSMDGILAQHGGRMPLPV